MHITYVTALALSTSTVINFRDDNKHLCVVPDFNRVAANIIHLSIFTVYFRK